MLSKESKVFFLILLILFLGSVSATIYRKWVKKDFPIFTDEELFYEGLEEYFEE